MKHNLLLILYDKYENVVQFDVLMGGGGGIWGKGCIEGTGGD